MNGFDKIPEERKRRLDELFEAFSVIGDDTYVYLCDMQYDFSRWSKVLTDAFGLPGEYMYGAGAIWEEHIHPEDRNAFHHHNEFSLSGKLRKPVDADFERKILLAIRDLQMQKERGQADAGIESK